VPAEGLVISRDGSEATLFMKNVPIVDQPRWPALDAEGHPGTMNFRLQFARTKENAIYEDPARMYRFTGKKAIAKLEASVNIPGLNFSWKSDPLESSNAAFAVMGEEVNGRYYTG
jgi:hypothetical protein